MLVSILGAYLPDVENLRVEVDVKWDGGIGTMDGFVVKGKLPSGTLWEVPLGIDIGYIYNNEQGAWLSSAEAAREVKKAVQSFRAMMALEGERKPRRNSNHHPSLFGSSDSFKHVLRNSFEVVEHPNVKESKFFQKKS